MPTEPVQAAVAPTAAKRKAKTQAAKAKAPKPAKTAPADKPTPRAGTKQALMIEHAEAPRRRHGRADRRRHRLAEAYDPRRHRRRAQEEARLNVEATRTREVGPNKTGAKGSTTIYRIVNFSAS